MGGSKVRGSVGAKGGHLGAVPPLAVINAPPTTGHYFIYFPDNDRRSIHYPLLITRVFSMLWNAPFTCMGPSQLRAKYDRCQGKQRIFCLS